MPVISNIIQFFGRQRIALHVLFWCIIEITMAYHGSLYGGEFYENLVKMLALMPIQMIAAYVFVYFQIPQLLLKNRTILFGISLIVLGYIASIIARLLMIYIAEPMIEFEGMEESIYEIATDPVYLISTYWVVTYIPTAIFFLLKMTKERFAQQREVDFLKQEKKTVELNFLKAQMNPHFLFNTLNNIYSLAKKQDEDTPDMILRLSDILDYTIYECQADKVTVQKEWDLIENYCDLQAIRYHQPVDLRLNYNTDDPAAEIAPLILISLLENAFKFAFDIKDAQPIIHISLEVEKEQLIFEIKNSKNGQPNRLKKSNHKGIGTRNVQQQLSLLYPNKHEYKIDETNELYNVILTINL